MRYAVSCFTLLFSITLLSAQAWEILNTELKGEKRGDQILISYIDNRASMLVDADTAYLDPASESIFFVQNGRIGIIDHREMVVKQEPSFLNLKRIGEDHFLAEDAEGYFISGASFPLLPSSDRFEAVEGLNSLYPENFEGNAPLLVKRNGKYGILRPELGADLYLIDPDYSEILPVSIDESSYIFFLRKADKWGAGSCEGIEVPVKYDEIQYIGGDCGQAAYIVKKKGHYGVTRSFESKPIIAVKYDDITHLKKGKSDLLFFFIGEETVLLTLSDSSMEWFDNARPVMLTKLVSNEVSLLVYTLDDEIFSIELTEEEIQKAGIVSLDWLYLDY